MPVVIPATAQRLSTGCGIVVVLALTFAVYLPTLHFPFVFDDHLQIVENPAVHSWRGVPSYFTAHVWAGVFPGALGNFYRPVFLLWLRMNDSVFGNQPGGWHFTTVLVHVLATLLVFLLALRMEISRDVALLAALIFGLHPVHIEAVAWASGVTEPLLAVFFVTSLLAYVQSRRNPARALVWRMVALISFALALLVKETALILPALLIVYEWLFGMERQNPLTAKSFLAWCGATAGRIWPYFFLAALYVPARMHALKGFNHLMTPLSAPQLIFTWPSLIGFWIRHLLWPAGLSSFYDFPPVLHPTAVNFVLPALFDVACGLLLLAFARRHRTIAFFAVWLTLPLIPLLDIRIFHAGDFAHDRYLYLSSMGLSILLAMLLKKVCWGPSRWQGAPTSLLLAGACLAGVMSYGTVSESTYFKDDLAFWAHNFALAPQNPYVQTNYATIRAIALAQGGQYGQAEQKLRDVVSHDANNWDAHYNLALVYFKLGNMAEAEQHFLQAIHINPNRSDEYFYLGMTRLSVGRTAEAVACVRQAIAIRPDGRGYHFGLGMMLKSQGDLTGALREFKQELANHREVQAAAAQVNEMEREGDGMRHDSREYRQND
jgi:hypothetical protein